MNKSKEILEKSESVLREANSNWDSKNDWFHEGNVSRALVEYLKSQSYECKKDNSDNIHIHGADIIVCKGNKKEVIEVKGYPSDKYARGGKMGLKKPTKPSLQATHWFADCLKSTILNYTKYKDGKYTLQLAMCFPDDDKGIYRKKIDEIKPFFSEGNLDIKVYFVDKEGKIRIDNLNSNL